MISRSRIATTFFCLLLALTIAHGATLRSDDAQSLQSEARAKVKAGKTDEAIDLYRRAVALAPTDTSVYTELARLLAQNKKTRRESEKFYEVASAIAPRDEAIAIERAANLAAMGDSVNAALEYRRAFELSPDDEIAAQGFVRQVAHLGATPVQIKQLSAKLVTTPDDVAARILLAELLRDEARYNEALDQYTRLARTSTNNPLVLSGTAEAWLALGYFRRAEEAFTQVAAHSLWPSQTIANQARVNLASEQPEAALRLLTEQPAQINQDPRALLVLADAYRFLNLKAQERTILEKTLALGKGETLTTLERLVRVFFEMNDKEALTEASQKLLNFDPNNAVGGLALNLSGTSAPTAPTPEEQASTPARRAGLNREAGEAALFLNRPALALAPLRRARATQKDSLRSALSLGTALLRTGDANNADEAAAAFSDVAIGDGLRLDGLLGLAQVETIRGKPERALAIYENVLRLDPNNFRGQVGQAESLHALGNDERAAGLLAELARRAPDSMAINNRFRETLTVLGRGYRIVPRIASRAAVGSVGSENLPFPTQEIFPETIVPLLGGGDVLRVRVPRRPRLNAELRVDERGMARVPFVKELLDTGCLSELELGTEIIRRSAAQLAGSNVEIVATEFLRAPLTVAGAVYLPGTFNVRRMLDLRSSLMLASGLTPRAGRNVYVIRGTCQAQSGKADEVETYERTAAVEGLVNLKRLLGAGDTVVVPEADTAFVIGAVARPSIIAAHDGLTLQQAVAQVGGAVAGARRDQILLQRLLPDSVSRRRFDVNLIEIEEQRIGDVIIAPGDIIEVLTVSGGEKTNSFATLLQRAAMMGQEQTIAPQVTSTSKPLKSGREN